MTVKEANEIIEKKRKCNGFYEQGTKGRCFSFYVTCGSCHYWVDKDKYNEACDVAKKSLEAWEKVVEDIETEISYKPMEMWDMKMAFNKSLDIIKKHLNEVEDEQTER